MSDNISGYIFELLEKFKIPIALSLVGIVLIIGGMFISGHKTGASNKSDFPKESLVSDQLISVDVSGSVITPGVYKLSSNSRVDDAINAAGGFAASASADYIAKNLNLAAKLTDGIKIYVPSKGEANGVAVAQVAGITTKASGSSGILNINTASQSELEALSGIGPVTASKIISDRPFTSLEDLLSKKAISKATYEKIKDQISVH
jgi:competence protein ComEA